ncbi:MAG: glycine zipper 2TM domain-containing protein [Pseudomonadota bacterium]
MQTQAKKSPHALIWIAGTSVTLFCAAGIAAIMGWIPTSNSSNADTVNFSTAPAPSTPVQPKSVQPKSVPPKQAKPHTVPTHVASNTVPHARTECAECGVVESTREIVEPGKGSGIGGIGGAVVGGVLGHQVGNGRGTDLATVAGAVGGAFAGNEIEKRVASTKRYEIVVRFEGGSSRVFNEANLTWHTGDHVRVVDGVIRSNG